MRPIESKFKIYEESVSQHNYFNKLVDERAFFEVFPKALDYEMLEPVRRDIASYAKGNLIDKDGTLMRVFEKDARMVNTTKRTVQWRIYTGEADLRSTLVKTYFGQATQIGKGNNVIELGFDTDWYGPNDVIILEGLREMPLMFTSEPEVDGQVYKYELVILTDNPKDFLRPDDLEIGTSAMQIGSIIGEGTAKRGNVHFAEGETFLDFEVPMTRMGWEMKITDVAQMSSRNYRLSPKDKDMKSSSYSGFQEDILWNTLEMKFMSATNRQLDMWLTYGKSSGAFAGRFLDGMTEKPLQTGPGLFEFMGSSWTHDFQVDSITLDLFGEFLPTVWDDKVPIEDRITDIYTGKGGLIKWQKMCAAADVAGILRMPDLEYGKEDPLFKGRNGVALNAKQYRAVFIEPFGLIRVHHLPFFDSELVETRKYKNLPITSYQYVIFNYGYGDGRSANIYILNNDQVEQYGYVVGTWGPLGKTLNSGNRFNTGNGRENAYYLVRDAMVGMVVKDPSYMIWFRPAFA